MRPHAHPKDAHIRTRDDQIPQEIPGRQPLNHATPTRIPIHPLQGAHLPPLLIHPHDPQRRRIDRARLHQRHHVHVPIDLGARVELRVDAREQVGGCQWRDDGLHELVEEKGGDQFVDVEGEGGEG